MRHHRGGFGGLVRRRAGELAMGSAVFGLPSATLFFASPPGLSPTSDARLIGCTSSLSGSGLRSPWSGRPLQAMRKESLGLWRVCVFLDSSIPARVVRSPDNCSAAPTHPLPPLVFLPSVSWTTTRRSLAFGIPDTRYHYLYSVPLIASCLRIDHAPSRRPCFPVGLKGVAPP